MAQTTYPNALRAPVPGVLQSTDAVIVHCVNHATAMDAGIAVVLDSSVTAGQERRIKLPDTNAESIYGITVWQGNLDNQGLASNLVWAEDSMVPVLIRGRIWVYIEEDVTPQSEVWFRHTDAAGDDILGGFRTDTDGGDADQVTVISSQWVVGATGAGSAALLEVNYPSSS